jgi:hypothetical protein
MNPTKELSKLDIIELIDTLELYLSLIKDDLPQLQEESQKISSTLEQLKIESRKVDNIGTLLIELKEIFTDIQKKLLKNESQSSRIELIINDYDTLKNRLNIIYALILGFFSGYVINILLPI